MSCFHSSRKARKSTTLGHSGLGGVGYVSKRGLCSLGGTTLALEGGRSKWSKEAPHDVS